MADELLVSATSMPGRQESGEHELSEFQKNVMQMLSQGQNESQDDQSKINATSGQAAPAATRRSVDCMQTVTELPIWGLPQGLQDLIKEATRSFNCPQDYCTAALISASATAIGSKLHMNWGDYTNYATLWTLIVGDSATGKSGPMNFFFEPLQRFDRDSFKSYRNAVKQSAKDAEKPVYRHLLLHNATDEAVLGELAHNSTLCWYADELGTIMQGWGAYSKSNSMPSHLVSMFGNKDISITRKTEEPLYIIKPNLLICGGVQPQQLKRMYCGRGYEDLGLSQRFLYVYPERKPLKYPSTYIIDRGLILDYEDKITELLKREPREIFECEEAIRMQRDFERDMIDEVNIHYLDNPVMASFLLKLNIHLCRWAITVTALRREDTISPETMRYCIECILYFKHNAEKIYCLMMNPDQPYEPTRGEVFQLLKKWYEVDGHRINQSEMARALGISQPAINKLLR